MANSRDLIAWYPLDGNGNDYSAYHNPSITGLTYNTVYAPTGKTYTKCASGGTSNNFAIAEAKNLTEYTVSFWVYTSKQIDGDWKPMVRIDDGGYKIRFEACKTGVWRYTINQNLTNKNWSGTPGKLYSSTSGDLSLYEKWHHIVLAVGNPQVRAYIDGESTEYATSLDNAIPGTFYIHANYYSSVSDFKVWNYCLSQREVLDEYLNPVAHYNFEGYNAVTETDSDGNAIAKPFKPLSYVPDVSGHFNNMSLSSTQPTKIYSEALGTHGLKFNGSSNYLYCPSIFNKMSNESWSLVVRFKTTNARATQGIFSDRSSVGGPFTLFIIGSNFRVDFNSMHSVDVGGITSNVIHEAAVTFDGTNAKFYYDGVLKSSWAATFPGHGTTSSIGASHSNGSNYGNYFVGEIYNVEIYPVALEADRIKNIYDTRIKISDNHHLNIYNISEGNTTNPVTMDYHMNGKFNAISEVSGSGVTKFYDNGNLKVDMLSASGAELSNTTVNGKFQAQVLNLNNCCSKGVYNGLSVANYSYDKKIYVENDGTTWVRIFHHNNPANALFSSSDAFLSGKVEKDDNRWFAVGACSLVSSWELMIKQKLTSSSSEVKYRWTQPKNPMTCNYADIHGKVVHNTTSGYTNYTYGGLFRKNDCAYLVTDNNSEGSNWYGAVGAWLSHGGGIPAYPSGIVTNGYMDLYLKVEVPGDADTVLTSADVVNYVDSIIAEKL